MGIWAPDGFSKKGSEPASLRQSIETLTPKAKQAFFAAASHKVIRRGTWDGCAFNAGGIEVGDGTVSSIKTAAITFEMEPQEVRSFIQYWDRSNYSSDEEATQALRTMIEEVGLFSEPVGKKKFAGGTFVKTIHESDETKMRKEFDRMVSDLSDPEVDSEFKEAATQAGELLFT